MLEIACTAFGTAKEEGFQMSPGLTKADVSTIPQETQSCGYNLEDSLLLRRGNEVEESRAFE